MFKIGNNISIFKYIPNNLTVAFDKLPNNKDVFNLHLIGIIFGQISHASNYQRIQKTPA